MCSPRFLFVDDHSMRSDWKLLVLVNVTGPAIYPLALMILFILIGSVFFFLVNRDMEVETRSSMKTNGKETMKTMKTYKFRQKNTCKLGQWMVSAIIHSQQRKLGYPHQRESRSMHKGKWGTTYLYSCKSIFAGCSLETCLYDFMTFFTWH
jgi:hypothetical protein